MEESEARAPTSRGDGPSGPAAANTADADGSAADASSKPGHGGRHAAAETHHVRRHPFGVERVGVYFLQLRCGGLDEDGIARGLREGSRVRLHGGA